MPLSTASNFALMTSVNAPRSGRPPKPRTATELDVMQRIWESRKYKTIGDALLAMEDKKIKHVTRGECYRRFGKRGGE